MDRIKAASVFVAIVEQGSMIAAAERLGMSRSMVTRYLSEMEEWAGARLLHRSTRRLGLTDTGEKVLTECYKLQEIEKEVQFSKASEDTLPSGILRLSSSQFLGEHVLTPFINAYLQRYPQVKIDLIISNHAVNLVEERIDLAIRITDDLDPNVIAKNFGRLNSVVCVSKQYLEERGEPISIDHLRHHNCLTYAYFGSSVWHFERKGEFESVEVSGNLSVNDSAVLLRSCLLGAGISLQPKYAVLPYLVDDQLIQLFPDYTPQSLGIYGIYRSRKHMPVALRVFIDELALFIGSFDL